MCAWLIVLYGLCPQEGLQALIDAELLAATNTACTAHASAHTALRSASHAILEAGHGLACLLTRYQQALPDAEVAAADTAASDSTAGKEAGRNAESAEEADRKVLDWSDKRLWGCNGG